MPRTYIGVTVTDNASWLWIERTDHVDCIPQAVTVNAQCRSETVVMPQRKKVKIIIYYLQSDFT